MKIKIKLFEGGQLPEITPKGDWIDCFAAKDIVINTPYANTLHQNKTIRDVVIANDLIPLGFAMQLPKGYEAVANPRSSTYNKYGVILANSQGVIDNSYNGENDQWWFNAIALRGTTIHKGDKICQFRIQLSQFATIWQKIKWLFWNGKIEFVQVESLEGESRGSSMTNNTTNELNKH